MRAAWILALVGALLLSAVVAGAVWLRSRSVGPTLEGPAGGATGAPASDPGPSDAEVAGLAAAEAAPAPSAPERAQLEVDEPDDDALPPDVLWVEGVVRLPPGTPLDERVKVVAKGRPFRGREPHSAEIASDGRFRVAFAPKTKNGRLELDAHYVYLDEGPLVDAREPPDDLVLEPMLGGRVRGALLLPTGESEPHPELVGRELALWGSRQVDTNSWRGVLSRKAAVTAALEFDIGGLPPLPRYHLSLPAGPYRKVERSGLPVQPGRTVRADLQLERGATLAGRVVDADGRPFPQAKIEVRFENRFEWAAPRETKTDEAGRFELLGVEPKTATISASAPDAPEVTLELGALEASDERRDLELVLAGGGRLAGRVEWPDGSPVVDGWVEIELQAEGDATPNDAEERRERIQDGAFEFAGLTPGLWDVHAWAKAVANDPDAEGLSLRERLRRRRERRDAPVWHARRAGATPGAAPLELVLEAGHRLRGSAVDDRGARLASFHVQLTPFEDEYASWKRHGDAIGRRFKDASGSFEIEGLEPGDYRLKAEAGGHAPFETNVVVPSPAPVPMVLPRAALLAGRVLDPDGLPIQGASVGAVKLSGESWRPFESASETVETDADGAFEIADVHPGSVRVRAFAAGRATTETDALRVEPGARIEGLVLRTGRGARLLGRVLGPGGQGLSDRRLYLRGEEGGSTAWTQSDPTGRFAFEDLPAGRYVLQVNPSAEDLDALRDADGEIQGSAWRELAVERLVELAEGETLEVVLEPGVHDEVVVAGVVLASGEPVPKTSLALRPRGARLWSMNEHTVTDAEGRFEVALRAEGAWVASVTVPGAGGLAQEVAFDVPLDGPLVIDLPVGAIAGRVVDESGAPVAGIPVGITMAAPGTKLQPTSGVITDAAGAFRIRHLPPGVYGLAAGTPRPFDEGRAFGRGAATGIAVEAGATSDGVEIVVVQPGRIEGSVTTGEGLPVADARVFVIGADGRLVDGHRDHRSAADGSFEIDNVPTGNVRLHAVARVETTPAGTPVSVRSGGIAHADLTVAAGTLLLVETRVGGAPEEVAIEAFGADGIDYARLDASTNPYAPGPTRIGPVPAGTYSVRIRTAGGATWTQTVTAAGELELPVVIELP